MSWKNIIRKDFGEGAYEGDAMKETREFLNDLEEFKKQLAKAYSNRPIDSYLLEILNKNLEEMKDYTKKLPLESMRMLDNTGKPKKGHPHYKERLQ